MTKKILFALTSHDQLGDTGRKTGAYAPEFAHPSEVFEKAGYEVDFVSVVGGKAPLDGIKADDQITQDFLDRKDIMSKLSQTPAAEDLSSKDYDAIYFAGGHGTMWDFKDAAALSALAAQIYEDGGVVAAVCHGPAGLINVKLNDGRYLIDGKQVSSFTNEEENAVGLDQTVPFLLETTLIERGAQHRKGEKFTEFAVADGRLVTGQNPASASRVAELTVDALSS